MNKLKILHCSDMHFDTPFSNLPYIKSEQRREDLRETFGEIIKITKENAIDVLLIAGDLFDSLKVKQTTISYIVKKLNEINKTKVFISPGNHDPYLIESYYNIISWPSNVHIFKNKLEKIYLDELNTCVYGIGFDQNYVHCPLLNNFSVENENYLNLMVIHGDVITNGKTSEYNPIFIENIKDSGLDYLAIGHKHSYSGIKKCNKTYWAYSGAPEGRGFDELGDKGIIVGELSKEFCNFKFCSICKRKYFSLSIDISHCETYEDIVNTIIKSTIDDYSYNNIYKIELTGEVEDGFNININVISEKLKDIFYFVKIIDNSKIKIDYNTLSNEFSLKGLFVKKIQEKIENANNIDDEASFETALKIGLKIFNGEDVDIE